MGSLRQQGQGGLQDGESETAGTENFRVRSMGQRRPQDREFETVGREQGGLQVVGCSNLCGQGCSGVSGLTMPREKS